MKGMNRSALTMAFVSAVVAASALAVAGQAPPPLPGQQPAQGQGRGRGRGQAEPPPVTVSPLATISAEVTGPGEMFAALMSLPEDDDLAHFKYQVHEYWATGTANGQPYKTRIVVRRPADNSRFSGIVLAEAMHPSGNAWMFHFTHTYTMTAGHIGLEIVTSDPAQFVAFNEARYKDMKVGQRDHLAGGRARSVEREEQSSGGRDRPEDDSFRDVGLVRHAGELSADLHDAEAAGHEAGV